MTGNAIRGTLTTDAEDLDFLRFFRIVQDAASAIGKVFFLWSPECHDGQVGDVWCEDLGGWLVPTAGADDFERLWLARDPRIWEENLEDLWAFARWSEPQPGKVAIRFEGMR